MIRPNREAAGLTKAEYETLAAFRYALRRFLRFSEEAAQSVGLTPQQHQALLAIQGFPGRASVTVGELAERLQVRPHSAVGLVDRLAAQELVVRRAGRDDQRQVRVELTPHGLAVLARLTQASRRELHQVGPRMADLLAQLNVPEEIEPAGPNTAPSEATAADRERERGGL